MTDKWLILGTTTVVVVVAIVVVGVFVVDDLGGT